MKERPIIFSSEMVKAILAGTKTQTRRIVADKRLSPKLTLLELFDFLGGGGKCEGTGLRIDDEGLRFTQVHDIERLNTDTGERYRYSGLLVQSEAVPGNGAEEIVCPYGVAGDRLWVITIKPLAQNPRYGAGDDGNIYRIDKPMPTKLRSASTGKGYQAVSLCENGKRKTALVHSLVCKAFYGERRPSFREVRHLDGNQQNNEATNLDWGTAEQTIGSIRTSETYRGKFVEIPPNHPRWSPLIVEILNVRVEILQDISEEDARDEGMPERVDDNGDWCSMVLEYAELWDSLHGKGAWDKNPWVWVIEFCLSLSVNVVQRADEKTTE